MARVTVEDCLDVIPNRFVLSTLAAFRARDIDKGVPIMVERDNDKPTVIALREIASHKTNIEHLQELYVKSLASVEQSANVEYGASRQRFIDADDKLKIQNLTEEDSKHKKLGSNHKDQCNKDNESLIEEANEFLSVEDTYDEPDIDLSDIEDK